MGGGSRINKRLKTHAATIFFCFFFLFACFIQNKTLSLVILKQRKNDRHIRL